MYAELASGVADAGLLIGDILPSALIIERDPMVRSTVAELLERFCPSVAAPSNGLRAFDLLTERPPALVVLGTTLPDLDALAFTRIANAISRGATRVLSFGEQPALRAAAANRR